MKQALRIASLLLALVLCVFTFVTLLYRSDINSFQWGTEHFFFGSGTFAISDLFFLLIGFSALAAALLSVFAVIKSEKWLLLPLGAAACYSLARLFEFFSMHEWEEFSRSLFTPVSVLLLLAAALFCFLAKPGKTVFPTVSLLFLIVQAGLFALTLILKRNLSQFIYIQPVYLSGTTPFYFTAIFLSLFLFYLALYLFCALFPLSLSLKEKPPCIKNRPSEEEEPEEISEEESDEDDPPLTLEDFGIER